MIVRSLKDIFEDDDLGLLDIHQSAQPVTSDERLIASFREIIEFFEHNNRIPAPSNTDMNEFKLFSRLQSFRKDTAKIAKLQQIDTHNLLSPIVEPSSIADILSDDDLDILDDQSGILNQLNAPKRIDFPDYIGRQKPCKDFDQFESKFIKCHIELENDKRITRQFTKEQQIEPGQFFILKGVMVYVAQKGELAKDKNGKVNARLRLIYENGTESDILLRSFARELYRDGRRITEHEDKLMAAFENVAPEDSMDGYIYVLSSLSTNPEIQAIKHLYKIGFSTTTVEKRIENASVDPTYLMAPVHIMQTYRCYNLNPQKFEHLLHRFFAKAKLDLLMTDNLLEKYVPDEWFVVPFPLIDQAIQLIINGEIIHYEYDYKSESIIEL